ncbi:MAG: sugar ABC transporter permease [Chloroflexota bacterium]|nr:sugar ABC transporter permease [Chloroflexota bacterium]
MAIQASTAKAASSRRGFAGRRRDEATMAWLFSAPALLLLIVFLLIPFLMAFGLAFTDQRLIPNPNLPTQIVYFRNFVRLLGDETFHRALLNNFVFAIVVVPLQTSFALLLAILVNQNIRFVNLFRTAYFSPVVTSMVVVSIVWFFLYNPGEGFINAFLDTISFGLLGPYDWLTDTRLAFPAIMLMSIWQGVGFQMVIYLAGLQDIPGELYEAAQVDGANRWQQFWSITLPQLRNTTIFVVIATTILAFKLFDQVWVMTSGGPQGSTMTTMLVVYREGFKQLRVGYASAISVVFFLIVLGISLLQRVFLREERTVN